MPPPHSGIKKEGPRRWLPRALEISLRMTNLAIRALRSRRNQFPTLTP